MGWYAAYLFPFVEGSMSRHRREVRDLNYVTVIMSETTKSGSQITERLNSNTPVVSRDRGGIRRAVG